MGEEYFQRYNLATPFSRWLRQKHNEEDEEEDKDGEDLDHEPSIGGDRLEIFEDFPMSRLHMEFSVQNICIYPVMTNKQCKFI